jgi:hypothetical protein
MIIQTDAPDERDKIIFGAFSPTIQLVLRRLSILQA